MAAHLLPNVACLSTMMRSYRSRLAEMKLSRRSTMGVGAPQGLSGIGQLAVFVVSRRQKRLRAAGVIQRRADLFSSEGLLLQRGIKLVEPPAAATPLCATIICQPLQTGPACFSTFLVPLQVPRDPHEKFACYPGCRPCSILQALHNCMVSRQTACRPAVYTSARAQWG